MLDREGHNRVFALERKRNPLPADGRRHDTEQDWRLHEKVGERWGLRVVSMAIQSLEGSRVFMRWHSNSLGLRETVELGMVARVPAALGDLTVEYGISHLKPEDGGCYTSSQMS